METTMSTKLAILRGLIRQEQRLSRPIPPMPAHVMALPRRSPEVARWGRDVGELQDFQANGWIAWRPADVLAETMTAGRRASVSRTLRQLEQAGLVRCAGDAGRVVAVRLTPAGREACR